MRDFDLYDAVLVAYGVFMASCLIAALVLLMSGAGG
jgi:hypothetical protein